MDVSIVIPAYNEEGNIIPLFASLQNQIKSCPLFSNHEIIFVDDGSVDNTLSRILSIDSCLVRCVHLSSRQGKSFALKEGFKEARYDTIITLDADLQNDPKDLEAIVRPLCHGYDFVQGVRGVRRAPILKIISSRVSNFVQRCILNNGFEDINCGYRAFKKNCMESVEFFDGVHRFYPFLVEMKGYQVVKVTVADHLRPSGRSKYNIRNRLGQSLVGLLRIKLKSMKLKNGSKTAIPYFSETQI